jgi:hypothetical protein
MAIDKINKLQWHKVKITDGSFTDSNSLATNLLTKPEIYNTLAYAMGDKFFTSFLTAGTGRIAKNYKSLGNAEYMWPLMGDITKPIQISDDPTPGNKGAGFVPFQIVLAEKYFFEGCIVRFESGIQARVQLEPVQLGSGWLHTCVIVDNDPAVFIPAADTVVGKLVAMFYTAYEEGSKGGGSFEAYPMWFQNQMTTLRMSYGMTGSAATDVMVLEMGKESGKKSYMWLYASEYQKMMLWEQQMEYYRFYGKFNKLSSGEIPLQGTNGRPVRIGAGILDQIASANTWNYNTLTTDFFNDFLTTLQIASRDAENKKLIMVTGAAGMQSFSKAILQEYKNYQIVDTTFTTKSNGKLKFENQNWRTYTGLLGTELTVVYNPMFDDKTKFTTIDPQTGYTKESSRMVFLDFSDYANEPNISMVTKGADGRNRSMLMWYTAGSTSPEPGQDSGVSKTLRSSSFDGFECHFLSEQGIKVTNPLACGQLIRA